MGGASKSPTPDITLFRDVFNASPIGMAVESLDGQPLFVNQAFCSFLGFSAEELRGKHCVDFSPVEDAAKDWALFQQLRAGSIDHYQLEKRYFRRDGSLVWGRLSISLLSGGPSPLVLTMVEDITDKRKAEEAQFRYAAMVESSEDAIASGTLDGTIVSWNAGAERMYGYAESEAIGKPITIIVPPELLDEEGKIFERLKAGDRIEQFETVRITKAGERINVSLRICPIKDPSGATIGCCGIARDITERKLAETALRASAERLRLAQWAAHIGTFDVDLRTGVDIWPPETEALYGFPPGGFGGTLTAFEDLIHPDDRKRVSELTQEMMRTGQPTEGEWRVVWPDGSVHWIAGRGQVLMDESGKPQRMLGVNMDVTERKRAEEALSDMTRKLIEAQEQERARIARELHDDIAQRLALVAVELPQLQHTLQGEPSEQHQRIAALCQTIAEISTDIQTMSHQLHSSKLEYLGLSVAARSFCREIAEQHKLNIDFESRNVPSRLPQEVSLCLFRVLQEGINNAVKHSGSRQIKMKLWEASGEVHLTMDDSGRGFDVEQALRGTGLGLTSMQERIRLMNGSITIASKPNRGTNIHVRVPIPSELSERIAG